MRPSNRLCLLTVFVAFLMVALGAYVLFRSSRSHMRGVPEATSGPMPTEKAPAG